MYFRILILMFVLCITSSFVFGNDTRTVTLLNNEVCGTEGAKGEKITKMNEKISSMENMINQANLKKPIKYSGADIFKECQQYYNKEWGKIEGKDVFNWDNWKGVLLHKDIKETFERTSGHFTSLLLTSINSLCKKGKIELITKSYNKMAQAFAEIETKAILKAQECATLLVTMSKATEYEDDDFNGFRTKKSLDQSISCKSHGFITQDYPACAKTITAYDALMVTEKVGETVQGISYQMKTQENQRDATKKMAEGEHEAGMKAYEKDIRARSTAAKQRGTFSAAKLGTLMAFYKKIPDEEEISNNCRESIGGISNLRIGFYKELYYPYEVPQNILEDQYGCDNLLHDYIGASLLMNQKAKDHLKMAMVRAGVDMTAFFGKGMILDNQADDLRDSIQTVQDTSFPDVAFSQDDLLTSRCAVDPFAPGCNPDNIGQQHNFAPGNSSFGGAGSNTINLPGAQTGGEEQAIDDSDINDNKIVNPVGGIASDKITRTSMEGIVPGAGGNGGGNPSSGGGGGGLGGGGGGGSGAGVDNSRPGGGGSRGSGVAPGRIKYKSGSGVNYARGGGFNRKKKKSSNPFNNLFGKKRKGKDNKKVLSFRELASLKNKKNIFKRISRRYTIVNGSKRLLEYNIVKPNKKMPLR